MKLTNDCFGPRFRVLNDKKILKLASCSNVFCAPAIFLLTKLVNIVTFVIGMIVCCEKYMCIASTLNINNDSSNITIWLRVSDVAEFNEFLVIIVRDRIEIALGHQDWKR